MRQRHVVLLVLLVIVIGASRLFAQDAEYLKWLQKEQAKYQQFKDERDKEFTDFLKREWKQMQAFRGLVRDETPKPSRLPVYQPTTSPPSDSISNPIIIMLSEPPSKDKPAPPEKGSTVSDPKTADPKKQMSPGESRQKPTRENAAPADSRPPPPRGEPQPVDSKVTPPAKEPVPVDAKPVTPRKDASAPEPAPSAPKKEPNPTAAKPVPAEVKLPRTESKPAVSHDEAPPVEPKPVPAPDAGRLKKQVQLSVTFFDLPVTINFSDIAQVSLKVPIDKDAISDFWGSLSRSSYEDLLAQAQSLKNQLRVNDWGYVLLLHDIGNGIFHDSRQKTTLFTWFMLVKSGYDAKVGYNNKELRLLLPAENRLYYISYLTFNNDSRKFYAVGLDPSDKSPDGYLYTYEGKYPGAVRSADFSVNALPSLVQHQDSRKLTFEYERKNYKIEVKTSHDAVNFFRNYPQTDMDVYFRSVPSGEVMQSLVPQLRTIIQGRSERDAANLILRFVQTAFDYKTDPEQFGREKPLFPDETIYYPYSDCEDRAVLFAYLIKEVLGLSVVGLDYPGHIATAVSFSTKVGGDAIEYQKRKYVICDPTYINADVGICMPQFKRITPNVIKYAK